MSEHIIARVNDDVKILGVYIKYHVCIQIQLISLESWTILYGPFHTLNIYIYVYCMYAVMERRTFIQLMEFWGAYTLLDYFQFLLV